MTRIHHSCTSDAACAGSTPRKFESTPYYASIEALRNIRTSERFDLALADAYSVGVALFKVLTGGYPMTVTEADE